MQTNKFLAYPAMPVLFYLHGIWNLINQRVLGDLHLQTYTS
jgi:hypothetical protein